MQSTTIRCALLAILTICVTPLLAQVKQRWHLQQNPHSHIAWYKQYSTLIKSNIAKDNLQKLFVHAGSGDLKIVKGNTDSLQIETNISVYATTNQAADTYVNKFLKFQTERNTTDSYLLNCYFAFPHTKRNKVKFPMGKFLSAPITQIDITITLPKGMSLFVTAPGMDTGKQEVKDENKKEPQIVIIDGSGNITLVGLQGELSIDDRSGDIQIQQHTGNIHIQDRSGDARLTDIRGDFFMEDRSGDMTIKGHIGKCMMSDGSGDIRLEQNISSYSLQTDEEFMNTIVDRSGDIHIKGWKNKLLVEDGSGDIIMQYIEGKIQVKDRSGDINIGRSAKEEVVILSDGSGSTAITEQAALEK